MIKVLFFAKLSEQLGCRELTVESDSIKDCEQLLQYLCEYKDDWSSILNAQSWLKAVNQSMTSNNVVLNDGDEVAFFPPVTGG
ncbi:molybdopterin converting factor subunit 1 [Psychromonas sp.]|nr:molybdopterin converting factor subunit 1 [Psychromonas sp.]